MPTIETARRAPKRGRGPTRSKMPKVPTRSSRSRAPSRPIRSRETILGNRWTTRSPPTTGTIGRYRTDGPCPPRWAIGLSSLAYLSHPVDVPDPRLCQQPLARPDELSLGRNVVLTGSIGLGSASSAHGHSSVGLGHVMIVELASGLSCGCCRHASPIGRGADRDWWRHEGMQSTPDRGHIVLRSTLCPMDRRSGQVAVQRPALPTQRPVPMRSCPMRLAPRATSRWRSTMMGRWDLTAVSPANHGEGWPRCPSTRNPIGPRDSAAARSGGRVTVRMVTTLESRDAPVPTC